MTSSMSTALTSNPWLHGTGEEDRGNLCRFATCSNASSRRIKNEIERRFPDSNVTYERVPETYKGNHKSSSDPDDMEVSQCAASSGGLSLFQGQAAMNAPLNSEDALVEKAQAGDESAFMMLVENYKERILGTASRFGRDAEEVRDLGQEIFVEVWKGLPRYNRRAPFEHWLSRVATNRCMRFLRRNHHRRAIEIVGTQNPSGDGGDRAEQLADEAGTRQRDAAEAREVLALALQRLAPRDALVITLREIEGRSVADVARDTGWSEGAVKVRAHRARKRLREVLEEMGEA